MASVKDEIQRKLFHMLGFIYVLGLAMLSRPQFLVVAVSLWGVVSILEVLRLNHSGVKILVARMGKPLLREREQNHFSGVWWMLVGVIASAALCESNHLAITSVVYLLLGDTAASLVGLSIKGTKWPGLDKRLSGSVACFLVCVVVGVVMLFPHVGWPMVIGGAVLATLLELGFIPLNDNFLIPAGTALFFALWT